MKQIILILEDTDGRRTVKVIEAPDLESAISEFRSDHNSWLYERHTIIEARTV